MPEEGIPACLRTKHSTVTSLYALKSSDYTLGAGEKFVYKVGTTTTAPSIAYLEKADYTWTEWDGSSDIDVGTSANSKKITVAVVKGGKALMSGNCTLTVKTT